MIVPAVFAFVMGILKIFLIDLPMVWMHRAWEIFGSSPQYTIISITMFGMTMQYYTYVAQLVWRGANRFVWND